MPEAADRAPIFVLGMMRRCGTNLLWKLLELHPDCAVSPIREDFVLHHADLLAQFVDRTRDDWTLTNEERHRQLLPRLGDAIVTALSPAADRRFVAKTPSVRNLSLFFDLFPSARLLVLIRDGRDVVTSGAMGFDWSFEKASAEWAEAARTVETFVHRHEADRDRFRVVRFENLCSDRRRAMEDILRTVALDPSKYDFDAAARLPVFGSSELLRPSTGSPDWDGVEMPDGFQPIGRWHAWDQRRRRGFARIAGEQMRALGYDDGGYRPGPFLAVYHRIIDSLLLRVTFSRR